MFATVSHASRMRVGPVLANLRSKTYVIAACAAAWALMLIATPSVGTDIVNSSLNIGEIGMPKQFNPMDVTTTIEYRWSRLGHQYLVTVNPLQHEEFLPELLESLQPLPSSDWAKGILHFQLRANAQWSWVDLRTQKWMTEPVRAADVAYSWREISVNLLASLHHIQTSFFSSVKPVNQRVVAFQTAEKWPTENETQRQDLLRLVWTNMRFPVVPDPDYVTIRPSGAPESYVGSGPYQLIQASIGDAAEFRGNPFYQTSAGAIIDFFGQPSLADELYIEQVRDMVRAVDELVTRMKPDYHIVTEIPLRQYRAVLSSSKVQTIRHNTNNFSAIGYNAAKFPKKLRLALTSAIDRANIYKMTYGQLSTSREKITLDSPYIVHHPYPEALLGYVSPIPYDPERAKALIQEVKNGKKPIRDAYAALIRNPIELRYFKKDEFDEEIVGMIATQIEAVWKSVEPSVQIRLIPAESSDVFLADLSAHRFAMAYIKWSFQSNTDMVHVLFDEDSLSNYTNYNVSKGRKNPRNRPELTFSPVLNGLLEKYDSTVNPEQQQKIRRQIARRIMEDSPYTFLFRVPYYMAYRPEFVTIPAQQTVGDFNLFYYIFTWRPK